MSSKIILKKSSVLGKIPLSTDLEFGEVALNYADGKLYFKNTSNEVRSISAGALGVDSASTIALINEYVDSAWITDRVGPIPTQGVDSASTISLIDTYVDSAYVQARQILQDFAYSSLTGAPTNVSSFTNDAGYLTDALDSAEVTGIVTSTINSAYVNNLPLDADTFNGQNPSYYLNYTNFTNTPNVLDSVNVNSLVTAAIDALVNGAPAALDTLGEIATQLGNDSDAIAAVINTLALKFNTSDFNTTFDTRLSGKSTTDLAEGTNLYYTDAKVETLVDSAYVQLRQDYAYSSLTGAPTNVSTFTNDANYLDSATVQGVINSTYVNGLVDSVGNATNAAKLNNQAPSFYLDYNNFTNTPVIPSLGNDYVDSAGVSAIITANVNATFINALTIDADTLGGQTSAYHLDYTNFTNTPTNVSTFSNDAGYITLAQALDSSEAQALIDASIAALVDTAPTTLDTLNELAAALGDDPNFATTITNLIAAKLDSTQTINLIDSAYVQARQDYAYGSLTGVPTNVSTFVNDTNYLDSTTVTDVIDSAYVQARINKAYINSLDVNAGTLDGQDGIYFLNYNNLINTPTILTTADVENIVSYTPAPPAGVDSDVTEGFVRDLVDSAFVSTLVNNNYIATLVDSAYVALRVGVLLDSAAVVDIVDSAYVSARATGSFGYSKIAVTGALTVEADQPADTLTLAAGANVTITTDINTDKITISAAPTAQGLDFGTFTQPAGFGLDLGTF